MTESIDWEASYETFAARRAARAKDRDDPSEQARERLLKALARSLEAPTPGDVLWVTAALRHDERNYFVAEIAQYTEALAEPFFAPMLDAAVDEVNPSANRWFIEPCTAAFGPRRVNEYLLDVVATGSDFRKAGAVNALYWAQVPLTFTGKVPVYTVEHATPESRAAYEALADLRHRKQRLLLETFVHNANVQVRRSVIPSLNLDEEAYPPSHRPLVPQAIAIARGHDDPYIRHRVEVQLGTEVFLKPLPHRKMGG